MNGYTTVIQSLKEKLISAVIGGEFLLVNYFLTILQVSGKYELLHYKAMY